MLFTLLGWSVNAKASVVDVWKGGTLQLAHGSFEAEVPSHGTAVVHLVLH